jgi:hypothetical protein
MNPSRAENDGLARGSSSWRSLFCYALSCGLIAGIVWSLEPSQVSRWHEYELIELGTPQQEAITIVESTDKSQNGCGAFHSENRELICRFEDPWRSYVIGFDPASKQVALKRFNFKRVPGSRMLNARPEF